MGDMNAKIGKDNDNWKGTMGKEGLGQMNENGLSKHWKREKTLMKSGQDARMQLQTPVNKS